MSSFKVYDEIIDFPNNMSIEINYGNSETYSKCKSYDTKLMTQGYAWHQIIVQHNGKIRGLEGKYDILDALFEVVDGEEIYPVAYRRGHKEDRFLVRQCQPAMDKLFAQNLRLRFPNGLLIPIQVQLNVAKYKYGQISPVNQITKALNDYFDNMESYNGENGILNLTQFARNHHLPDVVINLGNKSVLDRVCNMIYRNDEKFRQVNGIIMKNNGITTISPLTLFTGIDFAIIDLRDNKLTSVSRLCRDLQSIKADELLLAGNPVTNTSTYPQCLAPILSNFKLIDGIPSENLSKNYTPLSRVIDLESEGCRIDRSNKNYINQFESSLDWHAFVIPDLEHKLSKEELFDYFFLVVSRTHNDIYPCYYKFDGNEHKFLVRQCFDQLKYLVEKCNMEIKIPHLLQCGRPIQSNSDAMEPVQMDDPMPFYLLMNVSPFRKGQVEPLECIEKALIRRFNTMDRTLNLNDFQNIEGLENIIINLSSPNILSRVLMQASRKFMSACVELRLSHNKIVCANFPKVLTLMGNLKAIDLSNNWLQSIEDVKDLAVLGLRSLRLDGNPLCGQYSFAGEYIKCVKKVFTELRKLDNIEITPKGNLSSQKDFLCDVAGYDFVEQFIGYYFKTFEATVDRVQLRDLYHSQAMFSMNCNYHSPIVTSSALKRIAHYADVSRNILKLSDLSRSFTSIYYGSGEIMTVLLRLPNVTFDMLMCTTDTTMYNEQMISITVSGIFLDQAPSITESDILMGFSRTFILTKIKSKLGILKGGCAYKIINDQLNIFNPTNMQNKNAFKYYKSETKPRDEEYSIKDKEAILVMMRELTQMKSIWCTRCLEDANWNIEAALEVFLDLYHKQEIPDTAFI